MGLFDKFNPNDLIDKAKAKVAEVQSNIAQGKEERAALDAEMKEKAEAKTAEVMNTILTNESGSGVFEGLTKEELLAFTKDFYDKLILPASSVQLTAITTHPYINQKLIDKFAKNVPVFQASETPVIYIKSNRKQEFILTESALYFIINSLDNDKYLSKGRVPIDKISEFKFIIGDENQKSSMLCDDYVLATFDTTKTVREDFLSLTEYFKRVKTRDFEITNDQVDEMIRTKISPSVVTELKKYMIHDEEKFVYFAWGINSLSAKDYIACTTSQIIVMDRELFGATANVKQLYYEDITSASTEQNSNSGDLTVDLLSSALTAATKTCDLNLSVAGAAMKITTLYKVEAERVVQVYHEYRRIGKQAAQPQVIVQHAPAETVDIAEQLTKLNGLKEAGILTEDEFNAKKAELLAKM